MGHGETVAKGQHTVELLSEGELGQLACTVAHKSHEQPQLVGIIIDKVDGYGTAQESGLRAVYAHFNELSGLHFR